MAVELIYPVPTSIVGLVTYFQYINTITNSLFGNAMVAAFFIITFVVMSRSNLGRNETEKCLMAASSVSMFIAFFFMIVDIVPIHTVFALTVATIFSALVVKQTKGSF